MKRCCKGELHKVLYRKQIISSNKAHLMKFPGIRNHTSDIIATYRGRIIRKQIAASFEYKCVAKIEQSLHAYT